MAGISNLDRVFQVGVVFKWRIGGRKITSTVIEVTPHKKIMWWGSDIGTKAAHLWELEAKDDGTLVKAAETFDGWLMRLLSRTFQKKLDQALQAWLNDLKREAVFFGR